MWLATAWVALSGSPLSYLVHESPFSLRTGNHIEQRSGMVNFSVVGRNATTEERAKYVDYDTVKNERINIASAFNTMFPDLQATVGGASFTPKMSGVRASHNPPYLQRI